MILVSKCTITLTQAHNGECSDGVTAETAAGISAIGA
jgi:hypothetical protein